MKIFKELNLKKHNEIKTVVKESINIFDKYFKDEMDKGMSFNDVMVNFQSQKVIAISAVKRKILRKKLQKVKNA